MHGEVEEIAIFSSASESFSQHNIQCSIGESLSRFREVADGRWRARCEYEATYHACWAVPMRARSRRSRSACRQELIDMGCYEVSLGDTIGTGTPLAVEA